MYKTQIEAAKQGIITPQMEVVAKKENMDVEILREPQPQVSVSGGHRRRTQDQD